MNAAYAELTAVGVPTRRAAALSGASRATMTRLAKAPATPVGREHTVPANRLTKAERTQVLAVLDSGEFVDKAPHQVYAILLERGQYLCSPATMYRILREHAQVRERRRIAKHPPRAVPELAASAPGQVYSWDITKLPGPGKGVYYDAYVMIDIYSRYVVGCHVHAREDAVLAKEMITEVFAVHGIPHVVHADRGTSMTSKTVATLLSDLNVTRSHSRPRVSNDNPFSEALFKTVKYVPDFPERFTSLGQARGFMDAFVEAYNHDHRHVGIGLHTPANVHYGLAAAVDRVRSNTIASARAAHPERFATNRDPKILHRPDTAWINKPDEPEEPAA